MARNRWIEEMFTINPEVLAKRDKEYESTLCEWGCGYRNSDEKELVFHQRDCNYDLDDDLDYREDL
tara:strand:- start:273 stop:470 length:198 start_codon:yes stop_codon:yes gene_type:complete